MKLKYKILISLGMILILILGTVLFVSMPIKEKIRTRRFYENDDIIEYELSNKKNKEVIIENTKGDFDRLINNMNEAIIKYDYYYSMQLSYVLLAQKKSPLKIEDMQNLKKEMDGMLNKFASCRKKIRSYNANLEFCFGALVDSYNTLKASTNNLLTLGDGRGTVERASATLEESKVQFSVIDNYKEDLKNKILDN